MNSTAWSLSLLAAAPLFVVVLSYVRVDVERLRWIAVGAALLMTAAALGLALSPPLRAWSVNSSALTWATGGEAILRVGTLSALLLPFAAALWLVTVAVTPRAALDRGGLRRTALATLVTLLSFITESAVVLLILWAASVWVFLSAVADPTHRYQRRIVAAYLGSSTLVFGVGVVLLVSPGAAGTAREAFGMWLIIIAALTRKGIVPFHAWVPEVFDRGRLGPAILFTAPQLGAYVTVVLIVPRASPAMLRTIAVLALGTAVYGAALALVQTSARRACGYLFMSQSALVMAGLDCSSASALAGGLLLWLSAGVAFTGLARCVLVLEARRGRLDLSTYHGGYERMPVLATAFLAMGLACTGFPGTVGFVGQELLVNGAVNVFPVMGFAVVAASALTGLAVMRMYFSLFCGRRERSTYVGLRLGLKRREAWTFGALVVMLVGFGIVPRPLVDSRFAAGEEVLAQRRAHTARAHGSTVRRTVRLPGKSFEPVGQLRPAVALVRELGDEQRERFDIPRDAKRAGVDGLEPDVADQGACDLLRAAVVSAVHQAGTIHPAPRIEHAEEHLAWNRAKRRYDLGTPPLPCQFFGAGRGVPHGERRVRGIHRQRTGDEDSSRQVAGLLQHVVDAQPVHREQHGVGASCRLGGRAGAGAATGGAGEPSQLAAAARIAEDHVVSGAREQRSERAAHQPRAEDADLHETATT